MNRYALYYDYESIGDVLLIVFDSNTIPNVIKRDNDVVYIN